jgi:hypothetical protein
LLPAVLPLLEPVSSYQPRFTALSVIVAADAGTTAVTIRRHAIATFFIEKPPLNS